MERLNQTIEKSPFPLCVQLPRRLGYALAKVLMGLSLCRSVVDHVHTALRHVRTDMRLPTDVVYGLPIDHPAASSHLRQSGGCVSAWRMLMPLFARSCQLYIVIRKRISIATLCLCRSLKATLFGCSPRLLALACRRSSAHHGVVPYEVVDCLANGVNYRLRATWAPHRLVVAHVNRMKPCHRPLREMGGKTHTF